MTTWKRRERQVAAALGGVRVHLGEHWNEVDVRHPLLAIEVKSRKVLPKWALDCLAQARAARSAGTKPGVVVMIGGGMRIADGLVVLTVRDFQDLFGPIQKGADDAATGDDRRDE